jgi:hypothetical protein
LINEENEENKEEHDYRKVNVLVEQLYIDLEDQ